jgi:hypothetical protein
VPCACIHHNPFVRHTLADEASTLSAEELAKQVYAAFAPHKRKVIPFEFVHGIVAELDLASSVRRRTPRLQISRLRFVGEKRLIEEGKPPTLKRIDYDQRFGPGVNVVLVPDNDVGKSSILKTIKYALTGDDSDYDNDVKSWIHAIWLQFSLAEAAFTVHVARTEAGPVAYIAPGHTDSTAAEMEESQRALVVAKDAEEIRAALHQFFLKRLRLSELSWTQSTASGPQQRTASWRTFFQALVIPDSSDSYLLLDERHAMGNQDGLIQSAFLGLNLVEPINDLLIESQKAKKEQKLTAEERQKALGLVVQLERDQTSARDELGRLDAAQRSRLEEYRNGSGQQLLELRSRRSIAAAEMELLQRRRDEINTRVQQARARARALREAADLRLHFTGIEVSLCPNCDTSVDAEDVEREHSKHLCRLCGKHAQTATPEDVDALRDHADELTRQADREAVLRGELNAPLGSARAEVERLDREEAAMNQVLGRGFEYVLPTVEEQRQRSLLEQRVGGLGERIASLRAKIAAGGAHEGEAAVRAWVQERVRTALQREAERMNQDILSQLAVITHEVAARIGAEHITELTCSAVGRVTLRKNGVPVSFGSIRNPGERLRVKLAFFIAMMRLGRIENAGRHPGFLMIDQPGSAEMVDEDLRELAFVFRQIEDAYAHQVQVICFTARTPFAEATAPEKVYGPQAGKYAF